MTWSHSWLISCLSLAFSSDDLISFSALSMWSVRTCSTKVWKDFEWWFSASEAARSSLFVVPAALVELLLAEHTMATSLWIRLDLTTLTMLIGNLPTDVPAFVSALVYSDSLSRTRRTTKFLNYFPPRRGAVHSICGCHNGNSDDSRS